jgi:bifunctional UDP-N-acetylglucosamine pyrophosphorylase/glucosamine-1-phosphate N-acetyltransferase
LASGSFSARTSFTETAALQAAFATDRVTLAAGASLVVEGEVELGTEIVFAGACALGRNSSVENGSILTAVRLGRDCQVRPYSILADLEAGPRNLFGPFCFIRDGCRVDSDCILGAHVEAARSRFACGVKVSHRAFIGDASIGSGTIIGCGVVFCNWDGAERRTTQVGEQVILGSGTLIVAPLTIGPRAVIGAGSVLTRDIAASARIIQKRRED